MNAAPPSDYYTLLREDIAALVPEDCRRVLEVGSGFGTLGKALTERLGCSIDGVEINPAAEPHLAGHYRRFWIGDAERVALDGACDDYDCLIFPDVLEHLVDPWAAFARYAALVRSGGWVVASIPNIRNLAILYRLIVQGRWEYEDSGLLDRTHLRFFTRRSIAAMFADAGLSIETWRCNRDNYTGVRRLVGAVVRVAIPEIDVCQYLVRARKP